MSHQNTELAATTIQIEINNIKEMEMILITKRLSKNQYKEGDQDILITFLGDVMDIAHQWFEDKKLTTIVLWDSKDKDEFDKRDIDQWIKDPRIIGDKAGMVQTFF